MTLGEAATVITITTTVVTFAVGGIDFLIRKWMQKHRDDLITTLNQQVNGVNPHLKPLGVIVNRTETKALTPNEQLLLMNLPGECLKVYGAPVDQFDTVVAQRVAVRNAEDYFEAPDDKHSLRVTFEALAEEFVKRVPHMRQSPDNRKASNEARTAGGAL